MERELKVWKRFKKKRGESEGSMTLLISIIVLGIIILVHELGHFTTAKFFHMPVSEFSIGMGPQVYS